MRLAESHHIAAKKRIRLREHIDSSPKSDYNFGIEYDLGL